MFWVIMEVYFNSFLFNINININELINYPN